MSPERRECPRTAHLAIRAVLDTSMLGRDGGEVDANVTVVGPAEKARLRIRVRVEAKGRR